MPWKNATGTWKSWKVSCFCFGNGSIKLKMISSTIQYSSHFLSALGRSKVFDIATAVRWEALIKNFFPLFGSNNKISCWRKFNFFFNQGWLNSCDHVCRCLQMFWNNSYIEVLTVHQFSLFVFISVFVDLCLTLYFDKITVLCTFTVHSAIVLMWNMGPHCDKFILIW